MQIQRDGRAGIPWARQRTQYLFYVSSDPMMLVDPFGLRDVFVAIWNKRLVSEGRWDTLRLSMRIRVSCF